MKKLLVLGIGLLMVSPAMGAWTVGPMTGPYNSWGLVGDANNGVFTMTYTGSYMLPGTMDFIGDLEKVATGTYASEAHWKIQDVTTGQFGLYQATSTTSFSGTLHIETNPAQGGGLRWTGLKSTFTSGFNNGDTLRFESYESYNDTGDPDSIWHNVSFMFSDWVQPQPPASTVDLGLIYDAGADPDRIVTSNLAAGEVKWYKFTIQQGAVNPGKYLDIDTETTSISDTELGLYSAMGDLIATDDDDGSANLSQLTFGDVGPRPAYLTSQPYNGRDGSLAAGTYYLAAAGFNATFSPDFVVTTTSTATGTLAVRFGTNIIPEPATLALLGLGLLGLIRRR